MQLIDNINKLLGDDLKSELHAGSKLKVAATCFSIYAFEALRSELERLDSFEFIFTAPTFVPGEATDSGVRQRREFHIPKLTRERSFYGTDFEIQLKNKLTQRAIAKECADWIRRKARFRSNCTKAPMQAFACVQHPSGAAVYQPLTGFTAVELGYQTGDAVSNFITKVEEAPLTDSFLALFDQLWHDKEKLADVTDALSDHIAAVYQEKPKGDFGKAFKADRHVYDYVFTDSRNERSFVEELDASTEVVVYAKLPRGFSIPTPVGNYNPDWAIAFAQGKVRHVYFIAETKGSMSSMELREIERRKIDCARRFFARITSDQVTYDVVDSYGKLMSLVG